MNIDVISDHGGLLHNTEPLYMAANTYQIDETTGHTSFLNALRYVEVVSAKRVYFVHMSGFEDGFGNPGFGLSDKQRIN